MNIDIKNLYFYEPRLEMNYFFRFLVRLIAYSFYSVSIVAAFVFLFLTDLERLFWPGVLISLFLIDRFFHRLEAKKSIFELGAGNRSVVKINVAHYLTPNSLAILERVYDRVLFLGGNFYLELLKFLVELPEIKKNAPLEFINAVRKEFSDGEEIKKTKTSKKELLDKIEILSKLAFFQAVSRKHRFIESYDLFSAIGDIGK